MQSLKIKTTTNGYSILSKDIIQEFDANFYGPLVSPEDSGYDEYRAVWNGMVDKKPTLIARCTGVADVLEAVNFARAHHLLVAVRGGGHNVAGTAVCDEGLVIDLSAMKGIQVDPQARVARAQAGVTWAELDRETQLFGLATPGGVVSDTGIAGLTLSGGIGWLRNKYGLSCDNLISADVVTADGRFLKASKMENPDLFWAIRGGGGNFGVVTSFEYRLHPVGPEVMFVFVLYHGSKIREALRFYGNYCATAPDEVSSFAICGDVPEDDVFPKEIHGEPYVLFAACYAGSVEDGQRIMRPLQEFDEPMVDFSAPMSYAGEVQTILDEDYPEGELHYYWKSLYLESLDDDVIEGIVACNEKRPSSLSTVDIWHMGGAVSRVRAAESAFGGRNAPYLLGVEANWEPVHDDEANIAWARKCVADMQKFSDGSQYLNFPGFLEEGDEMLQTTFGRNYQRLVALKNRYDPTNLFRLNQNIEPSNGN
jgi:FAD/FMN-containing dehydrogenase